MNIRRFGVAAFVASLFMSTAAFAQDCPIDVEDPFDLDEAGVNALYACINEKMVAGYSKAGHEVGSQFRNWAVTATRPAVAGAHGNRLLYTFANDIAAEQYLKFEEEGVVMPVGSVLAKESIRVNTKKKMGVVGPLFIMTKVAAGTVPETNDWVYDGVLPNGKKMGFKQAFCHDCHAGWEDQDYLAYPVEEVRLTQ